MITKECKLFLFKKNILIGRRNPYTFDVLFSLADKFGIKITEGFEYADKSLLPFVAENLGVSVPLPFYRNFPDSVRELTENQRLFDQLHHYYQTYGMGNFEQPGYSVFEKDFEKLAFHEKVRVKEFIIISEEEAVTRIGEYVEDMLAGSRPIGELQYDFLLSIVKNMHYKIQKCVCKDTAMKLLNDTRDTYFVRFLSLSDLPKIVEDVSYRKYRNADVKKLNLPNRDRKYVAAIIHEFFRFDKKIDVKNCFERKAVWSGLLHHIHFRPKTPAEEEFLAAMRGKGNQSVYSDFEQALSEGNVFAAIDSLRKGKGPGALLRNLNYILSRCKTDEEIAFLIHSLQTEKPIILLQLLIRYSNYSADEERRFVFAHQHKLKVHEESKAEMARRKSYITDEQAKNLARLMREKLKEMLFGKLGKVYIAPEMFKIALPLQETTANDGYGVLPKGSRIALEEGKKVRAFTYWEKVNDIDLSVIGFDKTGEVREFSWRTMASNKNKAIIFSGDETSGKNGGSEYFDIDVKALRKKYPDMQYLVFCNNVFSPITFRECFCKAGYMLRDSMSSGEIYEPKTVCSSFLIDCDSAAAFLFGIDLIQNEFVWLNLSQNNNVHIAGDEDIQFLLPYFDVTSIINVGELFQMLATEVVDDFTEADVVVSDETIPLEKGVIQVRSCDFEKINFYLG